jgi:hypothetical protein
MPTEKMTDAEREALIKRTEEQRKYLKENEWLHDKETGETIVFSKTYLKKMNIMGWVYDQEEKKYIRTKRIIWSKFWLAIHNLIAHPMLTIYRPLGEWLHEYTAERMYKGPQKVKDDKDTEITATID